MEKGIALTKENGLKVAKATFEALNGNLPDDVTMLVYILSGDPIKLGDPATNAMAQFFTDKGIKVQGFIFEPSKYEQFRRGRPDGQALRQEWSEHMWANTPDYEVFVDNIYYKQKWTPQGWKNLREFGHLHGLS
ncbi:MAG: hypothetical protein JWO08_4555 [Verrucomicrobiaceae bacterium]|nr:hypothetical protein [Verrucomicrobiaceae bacterium]